MYITPGGGPTREMGPNHLQKRNATIVAIAKTPLQDVHNLLDYLLHPTPDC